MGTIPTTTDGAIATDMRTVSFLAACLALLFVLPILATWTLWRRNRHNTVTIALFLTGRCRDSSRVGLGLANLGLPLVSVPYSLRGFGSTPTAGCFPMNGEDVPDGVYGGGDPARALPRPDWTIERAVGVGK